MNGTSWMRAGPNSQAHWIKLSGGHHFVCACSRIISKETALRVKVERVGLAGAPGQYVYRLENNIEMCPDCEQKVVAQQ